MVDVHTLFVDRAVNTIRGSRMVDLYRGEMLMIYLLRFEHMQS